MPKLFEFEGQSFEFPDDVGDEEALQFINQNTGVGAALKRHQAGNFSSLPLPPAPKEELDLLGNPLAGAAAPGREVWEGLKGGAHEVMSKLGIPYKLLGVLSNETRAVLSGTPSENRVQPDANLLTGEGIEGPSFAQQALYGLKKLGEAGYYDPTTGQIRGARSGGPKLESVEESRAADQALMGAGGALGKVGSFATGLSEASLQAGLDPSFIALGPLAAAAKTSPVAAKVLSALTLTMQTGLGVGVAEQAEQFVEVGRRKGFDSPEALEIAGTLLGTVGQVAGTEIAQRQVPKKPIQPKSQQYKEAIGPDPKFADAFETVAARQAETGPNGETVVSPDEVDFWRLEGASQNVPELPKPPAPSVGERDLARSGNRQLAEAERAAKEQSKAHTQALLEAERKAKSSEGKAEKASFKAAQEEVRLLERSEREAARQRIKEERAQIAEQVANGRALTEQQKQVLKERVSELKEQEKVLRAQDAEDLGLATGKRPRLTEPLQARAYGEEARLLNQIERAQAGEEAARVRKAEADAKRAGKEGLPLPPRAAEGEQVGGRTRPSGQEPGPLGAGRTREQLPPSPEEAQRAPAPTAEQPRPNAEGAALLQAEGRAGSGEVVPGGTPESSQVTGWRARAGIEPKPHVLRAAQETVDAFVDAGISNPSEAQIRAELQKRGLRTGSNATRIEHGVQEVQRILKGAEPSYGGPKGEEGLPLPPVPKLPKPPEGEGGSGAPPVEGGPPPTDLPPEPFSSGKPEAGFTANRGDYQVETVEGLGALFRAKEGGGSAPTRLKSGAEVLDGHLPGTRIVVYRDKAGVVKAAAQVGADGVVTDLASDRIGSLSAGKLIKGLEEMGVRPPGADKMSPDSLKILDHVGRASKKLEAVSDPVEAQRVIEETLEAARNDVEEGLPLPPDKSSSEAGFIATDLPKVMAKAAGRAILKAGDKAFDVQQIAAAAGYWTVMRNTVNTGGKLALHTLADGLAATTGKLRGKRNEAALARLSARYENVADVWDDMFDTFGVLFEDKPELSKSGKHLRNLEAFGEKNLPELTERTWTQFAADAAKFDRGKAPTVGNAIKRSLMLPALILERAQTAYQLKVSLAPIMKKLGAKDLTELTQIAARSAQNKQKVVNALARAQGEALAITYRRNAFLEKGAPNRTAKLVNAFNSLPGWWKFITSSVVGTPFINAMLNNAFVDMVEYVPGLAKASKRVRYGKELEQLEAKAERGSAGREEARRLKELQRSGVYGRDFSRAQQAMGPLVFALGLAYANWKKDDEAQPGASVSGKEKGGTWQKNFLPSLGSAAPYWLLADYIVRKAKGDPRFDPEYGRTPDVGPLAQAVTQQRGGGTNIKDLIDSIGEGPADKLALKKLVDKYASDIGRSVVPSFWADLGEIGAEAKRPELPVRGERPVVDALLRGAKSRIPFLRDSVQSARDPSTGEVRKQGRLEGLIPNPLQEKERFVSKLAGFVEDHKTQLPPKGMFPRQSGETSFDKNVFEFWKEGLKEKRIRFAGSTLSVEELLDSKQIAPRVKPELLQKALPALVKESYQFAMRKALEESRRTGKPPLIPEDAEIREIRKAEEQAILKGAGVGGSKRRAKLPPSSRAFSKSEKKEFAEALPLPPEP